MVEQIKQKIRSTSKVIFVMLLFIAGAVILSTCSQTMEIFKAYSEMTSDNWISVIPNIIRQFIFAILFIQISLTFRKISINETPFFKTMPIHLKVTAVIFFAAVAVPKWIGYILYNVTHSTSSFVVFDEITITVLIISGVIWCLAQIFQYGYLVQDENYEIL